MKIAYTQIRPSIAFSLIKYSYQRTINQFNYLKATIHKTKILKPLSQKRKYYALAREGEVKPKKPRKKNNNILTSNHQTSKKRGHCLHQVSRIDRPRPRTPLEDAHRNLNKNPNLVPPSKMFLTSQNGRPSLFVYRMLDAALFRLTPAFYLWHVPILKLELILARSFI